MLIHGILAASGHNYFFELCKLGQLSLFGHVLNASVSKVLIKNPTNYAITLPRNTCLGHLSELGAEQDLITSAFMAQGQTHEDRIHMPEKPPHQTTLTAAYSILSASGLAAPETHTSGTVLLNGAMIYGTPDSTTARTLAMTMKPGTPSRTRQGHIVPRFMGPETRTTARLRIEGDALLWRPADCHGIRLRTGSRMD